jgi:hypothetical protein
VKRLSPPSGSPPPQVVRLDDGAVVALGPLAEGVADRYYEAYPDEDERYGPIGREWCIHDNLYLLAWAYAAHRGDVRFEEQVLWLARVLHKRDFPLDRLARDLEIAAEVVIDAGAAKAAAVAVILVEGAAAVKRYAEGLPSG